MCLDFQDRVDSGTIQNGFISTFFEVENEKFTGEISRSLADGKTLVKELITPDNFKRSIACGDSANDILMLKEVSIGVCINADEELKNAALENNWIITTPENAEQDFIKILEKQE